MTSGELVGVVGVGIMGRAIGQRLAGGGYRVLGFDVLSGASAPGVQMAEELSALGRADTVIVLVPSDEDVVEVIAGDSGLVASGHEGMRIVVGSSVKPATCRALARRCVDEGIALVDAASTGGVRAAVAGELNLLVGGDQATIDALAGVFATHASHVQRVGPVGAGQAAKSVNNLIYWATISALDEALRYAGALDLDAGRLREALVHGPVDSRALRELEQVRPTWFAKDLELAMELGRELGFDLPVARLTRELMEKVTPDSLARLFR